MTWGLLEVFDVVASKRSGFLEAHVFMEKGAAKKSTGTVVRERW